MVLRHSFILSSRWSRASCLVTPSSRSLGPTRFSADIASGIIRSIPSSFAASSKGERGVTTYHWRGSGCSCVGPTWNLSLFLTVGTLAGVVPESLRFPSAGLPPLSHFLIKPPTAPRTLLQPFVERAAIVSPHYRQHSFINAV